MKHLYIIGNGFDIHHHIPSGYWKFKEWMKENDRGTLSKLEEMLGVWTDDDVWWNDFETNLGDVTVVKDYIENVAFENRLNYASDEYRDRDLYDAQVEVEQNLGTLMTSLKSDFQKWASLLPAGDSGVIVKIEIENSFFLTFNYSLTLEKLYRIPDDQILHIHGVCTDKESIIVGHGRSYKDLRYELDDELPDPPDDLPAEEYNDWYREAAAENADDFPTEQAKDAAASAVYGLHKDVEGLIAQNKPFFDSLKDVEEVHIYGFSFAPTDLPYMQAVLANINSNYVRFEVSWFSERDKKRINDFFAVYSGQYGQLDLVRLNDILRYPVPSLFD